MVLSLSPFDLRWKIIHRCLPTARRPAGRSPFFTSNMCQVCGKCEENLTHLFFLCDSAKKYGTVSVS